jgi:two-component system cell cycle sensor histidine kinase/response regulator CckA
VLLATVGLNGSIPVGSLALGPLLTSARSTPRKTGLVAIWALTLGLGVGFVHGTWASRDHLIRLIVLTGLSVFAVWIAHGREKAEIALRASEQRYRNLFERKLYGVIRASFEGIVLDCNEGAAGLLGYDSPRELIGKSIKEHYAHPERREEILAAIRRDGSVSDQEVDLRSRDGRPMWALTYLSAVQSEETESECIEGVFIDITDRKQLQQQLQQSQKMEAVGRLAGGIAHDFNNLLTVILGHVEIALSQKGSAPDLRESLEEIRRSGQRAAALTRQLLAFSRRQVLEPKALDLNAIVLGVERMLRPLIGEDIHLADQLEPSLWVVRADPGQIEQVILNLAVNARDAMPRGGFLTISTENAEVDEEVSRLHAGVMLPGLYVMLKLSDTGVGMDAAVQAQIFEPFFTTKPIGTGSGLGLSMVYGIVKQSGGYIWVDSKLGVGTTFRIYLPRTKESLTALRAPV